MYIYMIYSFDFVSVVNSIKIYKRRLTGYVVCQVNEILNNF